MENIKTLVGLWFNSWHDGEIHWQGQVVGELKNGSYVVQLFGWGTGEQTAKKVVPFEHIKKWDFYTTERDMRYAHVKHNGESDEDFEWGERAQGFKTTEGK
jgi:hypothetical protein